MDFNNFVHSILELIGRCNFHNSLASFEMRSEIDTGYEQNNSLSREHACVFLDMHVNP